jgi:hypothetical protein
MAVGVLTGTCTLHSAFSRCSFGSNDPLSESGSFNTPCAVGLFLWTGHSAYPSCLAVRMEWCDAVCSHLLVPCWGSLMTACRQEQWRWLFYSCNGFHEDAPQVATPAHSMC